VSELDVCETETDIVLERLGFKYEQSNFFPVDQRPIKLIAGFQSSSLSWHMRDCLGELLQIHLSRYRQVPRTRNVEFELRKDVNPDEQHSVPKASARDNYHKKISQEQGIANQVAKLRDKQSSRILRDRSCMDPAESEYSALGACRTQALAETLDFERQHNSSRNFGSVADQRHC
jgi:hypothetical protein